MGHASDVAEERPLRSEKKANEAHFVLRFALTLAPIIAGIDKFLGLLIDWDKYLAPLIVSVSPIDGRSLVLVIGVVEIIAGITIAIKPRLFGIVLGVWILGIAVNLYLLQGYPSNPGWPLGKLLGLS